MPREVCMRTALTCTGMEPIQACRPVSSTGTARRALFVTLGVCSAALGLVGVFVPGMPTTVFVIAASYLFARSSPRLDAWLHRNRFLGPPLRRYHETGGMTARSKKIAIACMWAGITASCIALWGVSAPLQMAIAGLGVVGTATILLYVRTA